MSRTSLFIIQKDHVKKFTLKKTLFFGFCLIFISCNSQVKTKSLSNSGTAIPVIIRSSGPLVRSADHDTMLVSQYIRSMFQDSKGNLWFGTIEEGVVKYDTKTITYFSAPGGSKTTTVHSITEDRQGNIWLGTEDQGVYKFDGKQFRNYTEKNGLLNTEISRKSMLVDRSGRLWTGTHHGVFLYDPVADSSGRSCFSLFGQLPPFNVKGIMEDSKGNIWFASSGKGVFRFNGKTVTNLAGIEGLGDNYAGGMAEDRAGNIWFTMKEGICKYDGRNFTKYTSKDGLGGTEFWGIYIETSGIIWITARGSTTRFDPAVSGKKAFTVYTVADGLNCCVQSMFQDRSGHMWWGTGEGLYKFNGSRFYQVKKNGPW